jgi:hypothetical protein
MFHNMSYANQIGLTPRWLLAVDGTELFPGSLIGKAPGPSHAGAARSFLLSQPFSSPEVIP